MMPILAPHRPEDFSDSNDGEDDALAVQRCLNDAVKVAQERGGHDVELSGTYTLQTLRSVVVPPNANLCIYGRSRGAGFISTDAAAQFWLTGPTNSGERVAIEAAPVKSRTIRVADYAGITPDDQLEIRQYLACDDGTNVARWQQNRVTDVDAETLWLERPLDFPLDPTLGECTLWPYGAASNLIVDTVDFVGAVAVMQRFRDSTFANLTGEMSFLYGHRNRFSGIVGQPSFKFQSAAVIVDATARERYLDFDGCSDVHAMLLRSELMTVQQRNIKFAGCSFVRVDRAEIYGRDYTGWCVTEGCYDIAVNRVDASGCEWAVWTNGRHNELTVVRAFTGRGNPYDLNAADPLYFRRENGDGQLAYPAGSDVA